MQLIDLFLKGQVTGRKDWNMNYLPTYDKKQKESFGKLDEPVQVVTEAQFAPPSEEEIIKSGGAMNEMDKLHNAEQFEIFRGSEVMKSGMLDAESKVQELMAGMEAGEFDLEHAENAIRDMYKGGAL